MSLDPAYIQQAEETLARLRQLIKSGVTSPTQIGVGVFPDKHSRLACATITNWLGGRIPTEPNLALLRKWIDAKERQMRRLVAAK